MTEWGWEDERRGVEKTTKTQKQPLLILSPQVFLQSDMGVEKGVSGVGWGGGNDNVKATDFLTSLAALVPHLQPLHQGARAWGEWGGAWESGGGGSALS